MTEEQQINKIYLSGTPSEIKSNLTNAYSSYLLSKAGQPQIIVINPAPPIGTGRVDEPLVTLYFLQKSKDAASGYAPVDGQCSFRLMNHNGTVTAEQAKTLAEKIKAKFVEPLFYWDKGKQLVTYNDWKKGYAFKIACPNLTEGRRILEQLLDVQGHSIDESKLNHKTNASPTTKYPETPNKKTVMGKQVRERRYMAAGRVWFRHAFLSLPDINEVYTLVDTTGALPEPVLPMSPVTANYATDERKYTKSVETA